MAVYVVRIGGRQGKLWCSPGSSQAARFETVEEAEALAAREGGHVEKGRGSPTRWHPCAGQCGNVKFRVPGLECDRCELTHRFASALGLPESASVEEVEGAIARLASDARYAEDWRKTADDLRGSLDHSDLVKADLHRKIARLGRVAEAAARALAVHDAYANPTMPMEALRTALAELDGVGGEEGE